MSYSALSDSILTYSSLAFIRETSLVLRERIILSCLMGAGLFASGAGILKIILLNESISGNDYFFAFARLESAMYVLQVVHLTG